MISLLLLGHLAALVNENAGAAGSVKAWRWLLAAVGGVGRFLIVL